MITLAGSLKNWGTLEKERESSESVLRNVFLLKNPQKVCRNRGRSFEKNILMVSNLNFKEKIEPKIVYKMKDFRIFLQIIKFYFRFSVFLKFSIALFVNFCNFQQFWILFANRIFFIKNLKIILKKIEKTTQKTSQFCTKNTNFTYKFHNIFRNLEKSWTEFY